MNVQLLFGCGDTYGTNDRGCRQNQRHFSNMTSHYIKKIIQQKWLILGISSQIRKIHHAADFPGATPFWCSITWLNITHNYKPKD